MGVFTIFWGHNLYALTHSTMKHPSIDPTAVILPGAQIVGDVSIGDKASVWYNAVLRGDESRITIGDGTNIQDGCIIHVDEGAPAAIGSHTTVGHGCILHGCTIGDGVVVGMGSIILNRAVLEDGCMVGAGSLVTGGTVIPAGMLALGRPAKPVRPLTQEELQGQRELAAGYVRWALEYKGPGDA